MIYLSPQQIKNIKLIQTGFKPQSFFNSRDYDFIKIFFYDNFERSYVQSEPIELKFNRIQRVNGQMIEQHSDPSYLAAKEYIKEILKNVPKEDNSINKQLDDMLNERKPKETDEEQERLLALRILNKHFAKLNKSLHLEDEQVNTVIDAILDYNTTKEYKYNSKE